MRYSSISLVSTYIFTMIVCDTGAAKGVAEGTTNLFARPLRGGQVMIERIYRGTQGTSSTEVDVNSDLPAGVSSKKRFSTQFGSTKGLIGECKAGTDTSVDNIAAEDVNELDSKELSIENAYILALKFQKLWKKIDKDGNRSIDCKELSEFFKNPVMSQKLMEIADKNKSGSLTFAELAWAVVSLNTAADAYY